MIKPAIAPGMLAELTAAVPPRLLKRLDAAPTLAEAWAWTAGDGQVVVATDAGETVTIAVADRHANALRCSCLLSPRCLHVVAVAAVLPVASVEAEPAATAATDSDPATALLATVLADGQLQAVRIARRSAERLLATGAAAAGATGRAELLRAAHAAKAEGLYRLAAAAVAVAGQVHALQTGAATFGLTELCAALAELAAVVVQLERPAVDPLWLGVARREYREVGHLTLTGLLSEPVVERGQSGVVTWLCDDQGRLYRRGDVQPGDAERVRQAYRHGAGLGDSSAEHRQLGRSQVVLQSATASEDGRLGAGQAVRAVVSGSRTWSAPGPQRRFDQDLNEQVHKAAASDDAGERLLFFAAQVLGVAGQALVLQASGGQQPLVLAFGQPGNKMAREGLRALGCADGLQLRAVGRLRRGPGLAIDLLAVELGERLPAVWMGTANVGLDKLTPERLKTERAAPLAVALPEEPADPFAGARRRLGQVILGGWSVLTPGVLTALRTEAGELEATMARHSAALLRAAAGLPADQRLAWFGRTWLATGAAAPPTYPS